MSYHSVVNTIWLIVILFFQLIQAVMALWVIRKFEMEQIHLRHYIDQLKARVEKLENDD